LVKNCFKSGYDPFLLHTFQSIDSHYHVSALHTYLINIRRRWI